MTRARVVFVLLLGSAVGLVLLGCRSDILLGAGGAALWLFAVLFGGEG